jgi:hypothetical protein
MDRISFGGIRNLECGDSSPLSFAAKPLWDQAQFVSTKESGSTTMESCDESQHSK